MGVWAGSFRSEWGLVVGPHERCNGPIRICLNSLGAVGSQEVRSCTELSCPVSGKNVMLIELEGEHRN